MAEHHRRFPDVEMHLIDGVSERLISDLADYSVDIAFILEGGQWWDGKSLPTWTERLVVALPKDHPLGTNGTA